ncbi:methyltransferase domain-containing protein [Lipingzhangella sp. LS1_29]|uniref:Methyltransferase domain-containing protein n=1 Tax=Lipingzhangella rawalii TaxID=2055835 RepID=A0ABU2HBM0_9ACTN|nr:methyltransferase domain-containing protein [Lipingzhangella rawalii]MDS1272195.1 methyltransferase domain-containing protein [Lipingzhangella rawalii]
MKRALAQLRHDWTVLGSAEPLWAVCVDPTKRDGGWDDTEFLASGDAEVDAALDQLAKLRIAPEPGRALDFGCGAGRLSHALARHFAEVVGVDISEPMLAEARRLDRGSGPVTFLHHGGDTAELPELESASFDLVYSDLVFQHMPPELARSYLQELARVLRPGGCLVLGVPARERRTLKGIVFRYAPQAVIRWGQRLLLRYPAPMRMHTMPQPQVCSLLARNGVTVHAVTEYWAGDHWQHLRYYGCRDSVGSHPTETDGASPHG